MNGRHGFTLLVALCAALGACTIDELPERPPDARVDVPPGERPDAVIAEAGDGMDGDVRIDDVPDAGPGDATPDVTDGGDVPLCPGAQTRCGDVCVNTATSVDHCGQCNNACRFDHATAACIEGGCRRIAGCDAGYGDCDGQESNGCETALGTDVRNCGACGRTCTTANGTAGCMDGRCTVVCSTGFGDCNGNAEDGCEIDLRTTVAHCGRCGMACSAAAGRMPRCVDSMCGEWMCIDPTLGDCDPTPGCETNITTSAMHCGGCGRPCSTNNGIATCTNSACSIACNAGYGNCDNSVANGCEVDLRATVAHCGACGRACSVEHGTPGCTAGSCTVTRCEAGYGDCDRNAGTGCETNLQMDGANCGACGVRCAASQVCSNSACVCPVAGQTYCPSLGSCVATSTDNANCGSCGNACTGGQTCQMGRCVCPTGQSFCGASCVDPQTSASHCGRCGNACPSASNASATCRSGVCAILCVSPHLDCDRNSANGCEVNPQSDAMNCGQCGTACGAGRFCSNGACVTCGSTGAPACQPGATCTGSTSCGGTCRDLNTDGAHCGACGRACAAGQSCCAGVCRSVAGDVAHCGRCDNACPTPANAAPACTSGACGPGPCDAGYGNCDANAANGCETNLNATVAHCGGCGRACVIANGTPACSSGMCAVAACNAGYANCNSTAGDGCEVNTSADPNHCGACMSRCALANVMTHTCAAGACGVGTCNAGFANCNSMAGDGCEVNTNTSVGNCGRCGNACSFPHAAATCAVGVCAMGACDPGYANCNGNPSDGCEVNVNTDNARCGSCTSACSATQVCVGGSCLSCGAPGTPCCTGSMCVTNATCASGTCQCASGYHACGASCVSNTSTSSCGTTSCTACAPPPNATATCNGMVCGFPCIAGFHLCNGSCVSDSSTANCGTTSCTACAPPPNATATCNGMACGFICNTGFHNCGGSCVSNTNVANCGTTSCTACAPPPNATATCNGMACGFICNTGFHNCGGSCVSNSAVATCGTACSPCPTPANATATCNGTSCGFTCNAGFADCNSLASDGCEVNLASDGANCGTCRTSCTGGKTCQSSMCRCPTGQTDCAGTCRNLSTDGTHCGMCGRACAAGQLCSNGTCVTCGTPGDTCCAGNMCVTNATCTSGRCQCASGYHPCGASCVSNTSTSSCGTTSCTACAPPPNATATCNGMVCGFTCDTGFHPCNGSCVSNTNVANCGTTSCTACAPPPNATATCNGMVCGFTCNAGFHLCNGSCVSNTDVLACGATCNVCTVPTNATATCLSGVCGFTCSSGFANCNSMAGDGCEANLNTSSAHCGGCNNACTGGRTCQAGVCRCPSGQTVCNNVCVNTSTDNFNCGGCGNVCEEGSETCRSGVCRCAITCPPSQCPHCAFGCDACGCCN